MSVRVVREELVRLRDELREAQRLTDQLRENVGEAQNDLRDEVTKNDRLREALTSANDTVVKLSQAFSVESDRLREALETIAATGPILTAEEASDIARAALAKEAGE